MKTVLIQFDTDPQPSTFDRIVAVDAGIDEVFSYANARPETIEPLVHGAMFTRGPDDLKRTAIYVGGSNVAAGDLLLQQIRDTFFGPIRVSVMMDSNGSNTTAAAAVLRAAGHIELKGTPALVLGGTGPVGRRAAQLLASEGARVRVGSRSRERAEATCREISELVDGAELTPYATGSAAGRQEAAHGAALILAAGAAGVELLSADEWQAIETLQVAIDLNAVPPAGLGGIEFTDKAVDRDGVVCYGAIGVGGTKMKIHKAALQKLFEDNQQVLDTAAIYRIGQEIVGS